MIVTIVIMSIMLYVIGWIFTVYKLTGSMKAFDFRASTDGSPILVCLLIPFWIPVFLVCLFEQTFIKDWNR